MALTVEQAIQRVPFLAQAKQVAHTPLSGGITNLNYRIDADGKSYVLRITGEGTDKLGIRRDVEYAANLAAGQLGIAPEVMYYIEPEGYLVTRFVQAKRMPPDVMRQPDNIRRAVQKIRLFHRRGPALAVSFDVFRNIEMLAAVAREKGCLFPFDFESIIEEVRRTEDALLQAPFVPAPCHNDLLNLNWLEEEVPGEIGEVRLLDWEYAGMGDIFFDLANFAHHHGFNEDEVRILLQEYFGQVTSRDFARLMLMWPMSELREALWGVAQTGLSKLDEDFQGYADLWFGRARQNMNDARWDQWLTDAVRGAKVELPG
ncbi:MAG TPA: choline/ethanolamine kinase family protein [Anaerolineales bacterium]|nr:choline/ethanolamine kinase family protein [Anaerolineales bacterium]